MKYRNSGFVLVLCAYVPTLLAGTNPVITNAFILENLNSFDSSYDSLVYRTQSSIRPPGSDSATISMDIDYRTTFPDFSIWRDVTFQRYHFNDLPASEKVGLSITTAEDIFSVSDNSAKKSIFTEQLTIESLSLVTGATWRFVGDNNEINLIHGEIDFLTTQPGFNGSSLAINAVAGDNKLQSLDPETAFTGTTTINVSSGASLTFNEAGSVLADEDTSSQWLNFQGALTANIDNGALIFSNSRATAERSQWFLNNNASLEIQGSNSWVKTGNVYLDNSSLNVGNNTRFDAVGVLRLSDSTITIGNGGDLAIASLEVRGNATINGSNDGNNASSISTLTAGSPNSSLTFTEVSPIGFDIISLTSDLTINVDDSLIRTDFTLFDGGTLNISNFGVVQLLGDSLDTQGAINFSSNGKLVIGQDSWLNVDSGLSVDLGSTGELTVIGALNGNGSIAGNGRIEFIKDEHGMRNGVLSPGRELSMMENIGTIITDADVVFYDFLQTTDSTLLASGLFDGGIYRADLLIDGSGAALNDQLLYGDGDVDLTQLSALEVRVQGSPSATSMDGKHFTVISAQNASKAGSIVLNGQEITIVEDGSVPALIDFRVIDNNTNGRPDVTLYAVNQAPASILKHPGIKPSHTLSAVASSVVNPNNSQTTTTIVTVNPGIIGTTSSPSISTTDPVTGNTTTTTVAVVTNPDGNSSQTINSTTSTPNGSIVTQNTLTSPLNTPTGTGTAHETHTTLVTDANGNVLSNISSTTVQAPAAGTQNLSASANLLVNSVNDGNNNTLSLLNGLSNTQVSSHFESLHAEPYSSYMTISLEHADMLMNTVLGHASTNNGFFASQNQTVINGEGLQRSWLDINYAEGKVDGSEGLGSFDYSLLGLTVGQDFLTEDNYSMGGFFSYTRQGMEEHDKAVQDFSSDIYNFGFYWHQGHTDSWGLSGVVGYAYGDNDSQRELALGSAASLASANFSSHSAYFGLQASVNAYQNNWLTLTPELGIDYTYYRQESFAENGNPDLSLRLDSADAQAIVSSLGVNARFASLFDTFSIYPQTFVRYEHDWYANENSEHAIEAALISHPEYKQQFVGQNRGEDIVSIGLGLGSDVSSVLQINGGLIYTQDSHGREWSAGLDIEYRF